MQSLQELVRITTPTIPELVFRCPAEVRVPIGAPTRALPEAVEVHETSQMGGHSGAVPTEVQEASGLQFACALWEDPRRLLPRRTEIRRPDQPLIDIRPLSILAVEPGVEGPANGDYATRLAPIRK